MNTYLDAFAMSADAARRDPASAQAWAPWQIRYLSDTSKRRVVRAANRIGKTFVLCADLVHEIRGTHPYRECAAGKRNVIVVGESIEQMSRQGAIIETLWNLIPRHEIDPDVEFVQGRGLCGIKRPAIPIVDGPAAGTTIMIGTYSQGPKAFAGFSADIVLNDEPTPGEVYDELWPRVFDRGGKFTIGFTPVPDMPEQKWLRDLVTDGLFSEHHVTLTEAAFWLEGHARPRRTQEEIDALIAGWPEVTRHLRALASWEAVVTERWLSAWRDEFVRIERAPAGAYLAVGIDYGLKPGKQAAVLLAITDRDDLDRARVWVLDEAGGTGTSTTEQDAREILAMLERNGLVYENVDLWIGDRSTGEGSLLKSKSNGDMRRALAKLVGKPIDRTAWIETPRKNRTSVERGLGLLNQIMAGGRMVVSPRCKRIPAAFAKFRGGKTDEHKDIIDAARYPIELAMDGASRSNDGLKLSIL